MTLKAEVAEGELIPVETSEWAPPIVVVHKRDGDISICGDFKLTINPVICPQAYPLPTPEELFSTLANGESYSKLDLPRAYKQTKVTESSQPLLTINTHMGLFVQICQAPLWYCYFSLSMAKSYGSGLAGNS